ncbi:MAG: hypothetical protein QXP36_14505 [Conexivisphaerales archaeon]
MFENSWNKAKEEAAYLLANQLENVFRIYSAKGERKLFSEFADEIKAVYKDISLKAREIATQELSKQDAELAKEFARVFDEAEEYIKRTGVSYQEEQVTPDQRTTYRIDFMNGFMKEWGEFFKRVYDIHKQHNVKMWFHVEGAQHEEVR